MPTSAWYLIMSDAPSGSPVALIVDKEQADRFVREQYPNGVVVKVDVSHCIVRPIVETINEHSPIILGGKPA